MQRKKQYLRDFADPYQRCRTHPSICARQARPLRHARFESSCHTLFPPTLSPLAPDPLRDTSGGLDDCTILIHPVAARKLSPNTWAFIFGHEFAHLVENLGNHSENNPANELKADIAGARYAMAAGYRIESFLGWVLTEPNHATKSHGSLSDCVHAIATHFNVPRNAIDAQTRRYAKSNPAPTNGSDGKSF